MTCQPTDLHEWIETLLDATESGAVSIDETITTTRSQFPDLSVSDEELSQFIAVKATADGCGVEFDHRLKS